jgi:hypothetical protein
MGVAHRIRKIKKTVREKMLKMAIPYFGRNSVKAEKNDKMNNTRNTRREFFRKAAQLTFLSAMIGGSAYLLAENRVQMQGCADNQFCKKCQKLTTCSLDKAKKYKDNER